MGGPNREAVGRDPANQAHACLGPPLTLGRIGMKNPDVEERRSHYGCSRGIAGWRGRGIAKIPWRTGTVTKLIEPRRRQRERAVQIISPARGGGRRSKTVNRPPSAARPRRFVGISLKRVGPCTNPRASVIFHGMIESSVRPDEIALGHRGVSFAGQREAVVSGFFCRPIEKRNIRHCVDRRTRSSPRVVERTPRRHIGAGRGSNYSTAKADSRPPAPIRRMRSRGSREIKEAPNSKK